MHVRDARREDAPALAEIYRPYVQESVVSFEDVAPDVQEMAARMHGSPRLPWLVAEEEPGRVVGYAYATRHRGRAAYRWAVDCSVYLLPSAHRRGTGRLLYAELLRILGDLGYWRAYAGITLPNDASIRLHEALGFTPVGVYRDVGYKLGGWHSVSWWQRPLTTPAGPVQQPAEPEPWGPAESG